MRYDYAESDNKVVSALRTIGLSKLQATVVASRVNTEQGAIKTIKSTLADIEHPKHLKNASYAADRIAHAVINNEVIGVFSDYDVDGLTGGSVICLSLLQYFKHPAQNFVSIIGNRHTDGYGISDGAYQKIERGIDSKSLKFPTLIITVDCGSSDELRIKKLKEKGIDVIVTDHHGIPETGIPMSSYTCVNPQQSDCAYQDKSIAGVAVGWLVMSLVRQKLIELEHITPCSPKLTSLLDYVALGTVADAVSIASPTNRAIVKYGLKIINANVRPCWQAMRILTRKEGMFDEKDLGFAFGPRINARSRMNDPYAASKYLLANNEKSASFYLSMLDKDNEERKLTQRAMVEKAISKLPESETGNCVVIYDDSFHEGVQGIVASRITELTGKPSVVFSPSSSESKEAKGSGRTVKGIKLDDVYKLIERKSPGIHIKVGGHKGAFGCSINRNDIDLYRNLMNESVGELTSSQLTQYLNVDLNWTPDFGCIENAFDELKAIGPYGREFEYPVICIECKVISTKIIGKDNPVHAKVSLYNDDTNEIYDCIHFNALKNAGDELNYGEDDCVNAYVEIDENNFRGKKTTQLVIKHITLANHQQAALKI